MNFTFHNHVVENIVGAVFKENRTLHKIQIFPHTQGMMKPNYSLTEVKAAIRAICGRDVSVRVNLGRNKFLHFEGTLSGVYPSLFTVCPKEKGFLGKTSYSYAELLCGTVALSPKKESLARSKGDGERIP